MTQSTQRSHGSNIVWSLLGNVIAPVLALVTAPVLAQGLGVAGRGELSAATAPLLLATAVGAFGMPEAVTHYTARSIGRARRAALVGMGVVAVLASLASLMIFALAGPLSAGNDELASLIRITALVVLPSILLLVPRAVIAGTHNWRLLSIERAVFGALRLVWIVGLWWGEALTPLSATVAWVGAPLVSAVVFYPTVWRLLRSAESGTESADLHWRVVTSYGLRIWLGALSGIVLTRVSQILMVPLSSEAQAGLFAVATTIGEIPLVIAGAVRDVTFAADSAESADERLQQTCRVTLQLTFAISAGIAVTMPVWLPLLFGQGFAAALPAAFMVLVATVIGSPGSVAGAGLSARGRPGLRSWAMLWGAMVNLMILIVVTPTLGAMGAAIAMLAGATIAGNGNIYLLHKKFGLDWRPFVGVRREDIALYRRLAERVISSRAR